MTNYLSNLYRFLENPGPGFSDERVCDELRIVLSRKPDPRAGTGVWPQPWGPMIMAEAGVFTTVDNY